MKTRNATSCGTWIVSGGLVALAGISLALTLGGSPGYVAHEWGTFTSVQAGDGELLEWRPLESSRLPGFVYNWRHPGMRRQATVVGKTEMLTLQRMETPVIYFYSGRRQTVDVSVGFPQGLITEWYPQADQIGPSIPAASSWVATLDDFAHRAGFQPGFTLASLLPNTATSQSRAHWAQVQIVPPDKTSTKTIRLPRDQSGSHYFSARDTEAACVEVASLATTNHVLEHEKFIFYRGVGNFGTPLHVTLEASNKVVVTNTGKQPLEHLFVLAVQGRAGRFVYVNQLAPGQHRTILVDARDHPLAHQDLARELCQRVASSLVQKGLYDREATAMVNTWRDSWFEEDGVRVLYLLPSDWTARTLPLTLQPAPCELVRVMVGRTEVLSAQLEGDLLGELTRAQEGDPQAREQAIHQLQKLGRFAEPALTRATRYSSNRVREEGWNLMQAAGTSP